MRIRENRDKIKVRIFSEMNSRIQIYDPDPIRIARICKFCVTRDVIGSKNNRLYQFGDDPQYDSDPESRLRYELRGFA